MKDFQRCHKSKPRPLIRRELPERFTISGPHDMSLDYRIPESPADWKRTDRHLNEKEWFTMEHLLEFFDLACECGM